jgi:hypothetical protein
MLSKLVKLGTIFQITALHKVNISQATDLIGAEQCCKSIWRKPLRAHREGMRDLEQGRYAEGFCEVRPKTGESIVGKEDISLDLSRDIVHCTRIR